jgi:hypothetical protein
VWVKHASGTLKFSVGECSASQQFSGWARAILPQPFEAPGSGASGFHLAATDDGRIDLADQISRCEISGRRVLLGELVVCGVTGKRVLEDFTEPCPVSGMPVLGDQFEICARCRQKVSKRVLEGSLCEACRTLKSTPKDDPRLVWILSEHKGLDRWSRWKLAETEQVYIAEAAGLLNRLLVVVEKASLEVRRLALSSRFSGTWADASELERSELLT